LSGSKNNIAPRSKQYMNRPIKFRAQRSDNKEFVYGFYYKGKRADQNALDVPLGYARLFDCIITEEGGYL